MKRRIPLMNGIDRKQEDADIKSVQENPGYFRDLPSERKTENVCWHAVNADSANVRHAPEEMFSYEIVGMALTNNPIPYMICLVGY